MADVPEFSPEQEQEQARRSDSLAWEAADSAVALLPGDDSGVIVEEDSREPALPYPVVAFGSSAGGLQAFRTILEELATDTGMAFVLVPHLAPDVASHLTELTGRYTRMPVNPILDGERPEPNRIYILQPNETVELAGGLFRVHLRKAEDRIPRPIDLFFHSLAADQKNYAVGVVLSGADADGALGLKTIKGEGGFAIVQTPESAQHSNMPRSSIAADHVDLVIPPNEIAVELKRLARQMLRPEVRSLESGEAVPSDAQSFARILHMMQVASGLDLRQYKPDTIRRRIARRMLLQRRETLADYQRYLTVHKDELANLQEDVLIGVTRFFRDASFWNAFSAELLPAFFKDRVPSQSVRVWCAGCSTGEEAYSVAIALLEYTSANGIEASIQVFATDASARSVETARQGIYPDTLAGEIRPERLRRFFTKVDRGYQVSKRVRDICIFAKQNLCSDPPFSHIDFLLCRNVMIYFNQVLQQQILSTFHYSLEAGGFLLLGASEALREYEEIFSPVDRKNKMYTKTGSSFPGGHNMAFHRAFGTISHLQTNSQGSEQAWSDLELQRAADRIVLARYGPPGLIVDARMKVLQARGQTSAFVELASGTVSLNLLRILREGLSTPVREMFEYAIGANVPVSRTVELPGKDEEPQLICIDILPISSSDEVARTYMILFVEEAKEKARLTIDRPLSPELDHKDEGRLIAQLRQDLASTRFHLQSLVAERDAQNQELVSANEEIQSANEELQSTNEELETAKEELQSANEELQTVNDELQQRNTVLSQTGNDLTNLLTSVSIPLLMLNDTLQIRQFTPPMERLLNIRAADIGRAISEIRLQLSIENIEPILHEVLDTLGTRELEVQDREGRWHMLRIRPYRTAENKIEGLVLVMVDIDQLRRTQQSMQQSRDFADFLIERMPMAVVVVEKDCTLRTANTAFRDLTGMQPRELVGRSLPVIFQTLWGLDGFEAKLDALLAGETGAALEFEHKSTHPNHSVLLIKGQALGMDGSRVVLMTMEDITLRRQSESLAADQKEALEREVERTNRTLQRAQSELQELTAYLFTMQEEERRRVARELHDDVAQRLSALQLQHERSRREEDGSRAERDEAIHNVLDSLNTDVRAISHRLHPSVLEDLGLTEAIRTLVKEFEQRENILATFINVNVPDAVPLMIATTVYRIVQEALRNVVKHAGKAHVKVLLEAQDDILKLEVRDSGLGFDQDADERTSGLGLISMKERARIAQGTLEIQSSLGRGTVILLTLPLGSMPEADA